jgi:uncharacterized protein (DUF1330 family)
MPRKGFVIVEHRVKDFDHWRPYFVEDAKRQRKAGFTKWTIGRNIDNPDDVIVVAECTDLEKAKEVYSDPEVGRIVKEAGVVGKTTFLLIEVTESRKL